jgi:hypothetical protein
MSEYFIFPSKDDIDAPFWEASGTFQTREKHLSNGLRVFLSE